ncbi:MAG: hypothetical protein ACXW4L_07785 [Candidatus Limnocylindrales bacterium]
MRHSHDAGVPADAPDIGVSPEPFPDRRERPGRGEERGQGREVWEAMAGAGGASLARRGATGR